MIYYQDALTMLYHADCLEVMAAMEADSVDAICTDTPYGLEFMGKDWDKLWDKRNPQEHKRPENKGQTASPYISARVNEYKAGQLSQQFHQRWAEAAYRVLKPGGHMLVAGIGRTHHRMMAGVEDAGFEVRDCIYHVFGSGFPKSLDVSKAIDKMNNKHLEDLSLFGEYIKTMRRKKGWTRKRLDEVMGTNTAVSWWEGRKSGVQLPSLETYRRLKPVLKLDNRFDSLIEWAEAEREVIGEYIAPDGKPYSERQPRAWTPQFTDNKIENAPIPFVTAPATEDAKHWQGFGTALKPSVEIWAHFTKPLTAVPPDVKIIAETTLLLEALLWLLAPAKLVELASKSSEVEQKGDCLDSVRWIAAVLHILGSPERSEAMAMFNSPEEGLTFLNIALSWSNILAALCENGNTSTMSMETSLITGLKTLNSFLLMSIPAEAIQVVSCPNISKLDVAIAEENLTDCDVSWMHTPKRFALSDAGWTFARTVLETLANIVAEGSLPIRTKSDGSVPVIVTLSGAKESLKSEKGVEIWALFRKPLSERNVASNVMRWGTGAINVDGCRILSGSEHFRGETKNKNGGRWFEGTRGFVANNNPAGRFPPHLVFTHHAECERVGEKRVKGAGWNDNDRDRLGHRDSYSGGFKMRSGRHYTAPDGLETVANWRCHPDCPVRALGEQSGERTISGNVSGNEPSLPGGYHILTTKRQQFAAYSDKGTAARFFPQFEWAEADFWPFFYCAKAGRAERNRGLEGMPAHHRGEEDLPSRAERERRGQRQDVSRINNHPTVKSIQLMKWLITLITPPGGLVLDPFAGSGTTLVAAKELGFRSVGIELTNTDEEPYCEIAKRRVMAAEVGMAL